MQIVIDIPETKYNTIMNYPKEWDEWALEAIKNGTPLPKGHGVLKDANEILKAMDTWDKFGYTETGCFVRKPYNDYVPYVLYEDMVKSVSGTETIIEADKAEREDKE